MSSHAGTDSKVFAGFVPVSDHKREFEKFFQKGLDLLDKANGKENSRTERFYSAMSAFANFALAAMRWHGVRSLAKYATSHTIRHLEHAVELEGWKAAEIHRELQLAQEGEIKSSISRSGCIAPTSEQLLKSAIRNAELLRDRVKALGPVTHVGDRLY